MNDMAEDNIVMQRESLSEDTFFCPSFDVVSPTASESDNANSIE